MPLQGGAGNWADWRGWVQLMGCWGVAAWPPCVCVRACVCVCVCVCVRARGCVASVLTLCTASQGSRVIPYHTSLRSFRTQGRGIFLSWWYNVKSKQAWFLNPNRFLIGNFRCYTHSYIMRKGNASPKGNLQKSQLAFLEKETDSVSGSEKFQPWEGLSLRTGQEPHLLWERRDCFCLISGKMTVVLKSKRWAWLFQNTERAGGVGSIPGEETVSLEAWRPQASSIPGQSGDWKLAVKRAACETAGEARWDLQPCNSAGKLGLGQELTGQGGPSPASSG